MICSKCGRNSTPEEKYCANCGNSLTNNIMNQVQVQNNQYNANYNYQYQMPNNQVPSYQGYQNVAVNSDNKVLYICCAIIIIATVIIIGIILSKNSSSVYISEEHIKEEDPTIKAREKGLTVIETDHVYYISLNNDSKASKKIIEDSVNQKDKCPKEIVEIENRIVKNYGVTAVNLCEMEKPLALEIEKVVKRIYEEYPTSHGYLTNLSLINPDANGYIACFMPFFSFTFPEGDETFPVTNKTQVLLNTTYFLDVSFYEKAMKNSVASGHFPKGANTSSAVAHELGHYLSFITLLKRYNVDSVLIERNENIQSIIQITKDFSSGENSLEMIKEAYNNYKNKYNSNISIDEFRSSISGYAVAKDNTGEYIYDETIAEAFHDYYLNGANASKASLEIVKVLNERLK